MPATLPCPGCSGSSSLLVAATDRNRAVSDRVFHYFRCDDCGLVFLVDPPEDLARYYTSEYYSVPADDELAQQRRRLEYQIDLVLRHVEPGRLVEIGPRWGVFARAAKDAGFDVSAIEMDPHSCDYLRSTVGVDAHCSDQPDAVLAELPPSRVIAMWHVLEHLVDPWGCLAAAAANLEPGGILVFATPNPASLAFRIMRGRWTHLDAPRHLSLLPAPLVERRLRESGLRLETLTTRDRGARSLSRSAWQRLLAPQTAGPTRRRLAVGPGLALWAVAAAPEMIDRAGPAYTAVFRKEP